MLPRLKQIFHLYRFGSPHNCQVAGEITKQIQSRHGEAYDKKNIRYPSLFV